MTHSNKSHDRQGDDTAMAQGSLGASTRYVTVRLELEDKRATSDDAILGERAVTRKRLHHFNLVDDETVVMLYDLRGDLSRARETLSAASDVLNYDVVDHGNGTGVAYVHCKLRNPVKSLVSTLHQFEVVPDMPLGFTTNGSVRATIIGEAQALSETLDAIADIVEVHLEKTGDYRPGIGELEATLTDRQHQILTVAVNQGYYEVPRRTTLEDVAAEMNLSRATVGEHLQKSEAKILSRVVR